MSESASGSLMGHSGAVDPGSPAARFDERAARLRKAIQSAVDPLPPRLATINKSRGFDQKFVAEAIEAWLTNEVLDNPGFNTLEFLGVFCSVESSNPACFVVLAQEYKAGGRRAEALAAINRAMALNQNDLHSQRVFMDIRHWADPSIQSPEEVDAYLKGCFCSSPFEHFETVPGGNVFVCCPSYLPVQIGNLYSQTAEQLWTGDVAKTLRASIVDGSFRYCSRLHCGRITNRTLDTKDAANAFVTESVEANSGELISKGTAGRECALPKSLILSHDRSCNLACPSCRSDFILAKKDEQAALNEFLERSIIPIIRNARLLNVTGSGDPFGSNHFRALLKHIDRETYPNIRINLHTNGQLFDERAWFDLGLQGLVRDVEISIDAAKSETYNIVRRGGDFGRLCRNLGFISHLRKIREIRHLSFSFVVQALNFEEMPAFVQMGESFGVDQVQFNMIRNWGTYSPEAFEEQFIGSKSHHAHAALLEVLKSPELRKSFVSSGNLASYQ